MTTVKEMREYLATIPDDFIILNTWGGNYMHIDMNAIQEEVIIKGQKTNCLVFDADYD